MIRREIEQIGRQLRQLDQYRQEWGTLYRHNDAPAYVPLPSTAWEAHGGAIGLTDSGYDAVDAAYRWAAHFDDQMGVRITTFGETWAEPDLDGLRRAFEAAAREITSC